jgi:hypothetical protein
VCTLLRAAESGHITLIRVQVLSYSLVHIRVPLEPMVLGRSPGPRAMPAGPRPGRRDVDMMCARLEPVRRNGSPWEPDLAAHLIPCG